MLKNLRFPLLYLAEVLLLLPLLVGFIGICAFWGAQPVDTLNLHGKSLPPGWEAAIPNHGKFLPGYLVANHPIIFCSVVLLQLGSATVLYRIRKLQEQQRKENPASEGAHKIARSCVIAIWGVALYVLVFQVLVGVSPA